MDEVETASDSSGTGVLGSILQTKMKSNGPVSTATIFLIHAGERAHDHFLVLRGGSMKIQGKLK
jgi:hypothetical protein